MAQGLRAQQMGARAEPDRALAHRGSRPSAPVRARFPPSVTGGSGVLIRNATGAGRTSEGVIAP